MIRLQSDSNLSEHQEIAVLISSNDLIQIFRSSLIAESAITMTGAKKSGWQGISLLVTLSLYAKKYCLIQKKPGPPNFTPLRILETQLSTFYGASQFCGKSDRERLKISFFKPIRFLLASLSGIAGHPGWNPVRSAA